MVSDKEREGQAHIEGKQKMGEGLQSDVTATDSFFSCVKYIVRDNKLRGFFSSYAQ